MVCGALFASFAKVGLVRPNLRFGGHGLGAHRDPPLARDLLKRTGRGHWVWSPGRRELGVV